VPGGFGAAAGPNDGWHAAFHMLTKAFLRTAVGWGSAAHLRKRLDELEMSVQANPLTKKPELKCSGGNSRLIVFFYDMMLMISETFSSLIWFLSLKLLLMVGL